MKWALFLIPLMMACSGLQDERALYGMLNEKPFIQKRSSAGFAFSARYLPAAYLAFKDMTTDERYAYNHLVYDSLRATYDDVVTILFNIGPDDETGDIDIMKYQISEYKDYQQRVLDINFNIENYFYIENGGKKIYPILSNLENQYGMKPDRNIYLVFPKNDLRDDFVLVYEDAFFESGIRRFTFEKAVFDLPELKFIPS